MTDRSMEGAEAERDGDVAAFGLRVRQLRDGRGLTLVDLAAASQVSRAMLSRIERGEASPTIGVAKRIAQALNTSLSFLAGAVEQRRAVVATRAGERAVFRDAATGFERHLLSPPAAGSGVELVLHRLPAATSTGNLPPATGGTEKNVVVLRGMVRVEVDGEAIVLAEGDALFFEADVSHAFSNLGDGTAEYLLFISRRRDWPNTPSSVFPF